MFIKTNDFELEITQGGEVYLGSKRSGQTFKKWAEIDEDIRNSLEKVVQQAESLIKHSEKLLIAPVSA